MKRLVILWIYLVTNVVAQDVPCEIDIQKEWGFSEYGPPNGQHISTTTKFNDPHDCHQECCDYAFTKGCSASWFIRVPDGYGGVSSVCQLWRCDPCTTIVYKQPQYDSQVGLIVKSEPDVYIPQLQILGENTIENNATQQIQGTVNEFGEYVPAQFPPEQGPVVENSNDLQPNDQIPLNLNGIPPYQQPYDNLPSYQETPQQNPQSPYQDTGSSSYQNMESFPYYTDTQQNSQPEYNPNTVYDPYGIIPNSESQQNQPIQDPNMLPQNQPIVDSNMLPQPAETQRGHWVYNPATGDYVFVNEGTQPDNSLYNTDPYSNSQPENVPYTGDTYPTGESQPLDNSWLLDSIQEAQTDNSTSESFNDTDILSNTNESINMTSSWWEVNATTTYAPTSADSGWFNFWPFGDDADNDDDDDETEEELEKEWKEEEEEEEKEWKQEMKQFEEEQDEYTTPEYDSSTEEVSTPSSEEKSSEESSSDNFEYENDIDHNNDNQWNFGDTDDDQQEQSDDGWLQNLANQGKEQTRPSVLENNQYIQGRPQSVGQSEFSNPSISATSYINAPVIAVGACVAVVIVLLLLVFLGKRLTGKTDRAQYKPLRESFSGSSTYHEDI